jgi:predicted nucleic acid-binding protein
MATLSIYLDTSVVVALFLPDVFEERAEAFLATAPSGLTLSDFVAAEFSAVVNVRLRNRDIALPAARDALSNFDDWSMRRCTRDEMLPADVREAERILRRLDLPLRAPDAIHLVIAQRINAQLATFDKQMSTAARALKIPVARA